AILIVIAGLLLSASVSSPKVVTQQPSPEPIVRRAPPQAPIAVAPISGFQMGVVSACSIVSGFGNCIRRDDFNPGDPVFLYAEALNIAHTGQVNALFNYRVIGPDGSQVFAETTPVKGNSAAHWGAWPQFRLPSDAAAGTYSAMVEVRDNLSQQMASGTG